MSIRLERNADGSASHEVIERDGSFFVVEAGAPQDVPGRRSSTEELKAWALEHAPGRMAKALRIGLGLSP